MDGLIPFMKRNYTDSNAALVLSDDILIEMLQFLYFYMSCILIYKNHGKFYTLISLVYFSADFFNLSKNIFIR